MKYYKGKFRSYLNDLGKRKPSPGGGSAICLVFCTSISLIEKAINYSLISSPKTLTDKKKNKKLKTTLVKLSKSKKKIYPYIDKDGYLFGKIMSTKGKKRKEFIAKSERIIVDLGRASGEVFSLAKDIESGIKKSIISDYYIGLDLIKSALFGSILNLEANSTIFGTKNKFIGVFEKVYKNI